MSLIQHSTPHSIRTSTFAEVDELVAFDREELIHRCMGSVDLAERLLNRFEQRFPLEMAEIETSWKSGDGATLTRITHRLKGAAANIAAPALRSVLQKVEDAARAQRLETIEGCLAEVAKEWQRFVAGKQTSSANNGYSKACHLSQDRSCSDAAEGSDASLGG